AGVMLSGTKRTLPSPSPTFVPPVWPDWPRAGAQLTNGCGRGWGTKHGAEPGCASLRGVLWHSIGRHFDVGGAHSEPKVVGEEASPDEPHEAYTSPKRIVFDKPSGTERGRALAPCTQSASLLPFGLPKM